MFLVLLGWYMAFPGPCSPMDYWRGVSVNPMRYWPCLYEKPYSPISLYDLDLELIFLKRVLVPSKVEDKVKLRIKNEHSRIFKIFIYLFFAVNLKEARQRRMYQAEHDT